MLLVVSECLLTNSVRVFTHLRQETSTEPMVVSTRERILDAAARVIRDHGLAKASTKLIAQQAGLSEAMLYKHFDSKHELFVHVLSERLPRLSKVISDLPQRVGRGSVQENLERVAAAAVDFYAAGFSMTASMFSEPRLLEDFRQWATERGLGPHVPVAAVADYLAAERRIGRVAPGADPPAAAALLMGACFQRALLERFTSDPPTETDRPAPEALVAALCGPLLGRPGREQDSDRVGPST